MSQGEQIICKLLNESNIKYEREKRFSDLKHGLFRYDFYLTFKNNSHIIIEFNGIQHYEYVSKFYHTKSDWRKAQEYDRRKISYANAKDIPIYIIPYWDLHSLREAADLFKKEYLAKTRWHNDEIYRDYKNKKTGN